MSAQLKRLGRFVWIVAKNTWGAVVAGYEQKGAGKSGLFTVRRKDDERDGPEASSVNPSAEWEKRRKVEMGGLNAQ